jgi:hypothetical protein
MRTDRQSNTHGGANLRHCMTVTQELRDRGVKHAARHFILYDLLTELIPFTDCGRVDRSIFFFFRNSIRQGPGGSKGSATSRRNAHHTSEVTTMHITRQK